MAPTLFQRKYSPLPEGASGNIPGKRFAADEDRKGKGLFSYENKPFLYPLVEISGIEPLTS